LTSWLFPDVILPFVVTRAALLMVAEVTALTIPSTLGSTPEPLPQTVAWYAPLVRLDAEWYLAIAANWYQYDPTAPPVVQQSPVFFPLYPALVRLLNTLTPGVGLLACGLIVANVSALLALASLYRLVQRDLSLPDAQRTVWYIVAFPVSFALSAAYAESVFFLVTVLAVYAARSDRWLGAGLAATAAALTRPYGVLVVVPLALEYARSRAGSPRSLLDVRGASLLLPIVALGGWMAYMYALSGDPLLFGHLQVAWDDQRLTSPLETLLTGYGRTRDQQLQGRFDIGSLRFVAAALAVAATALSWRTLPMMYAAFATVFCLVILSSGSLVSIWRHVLVIWPLFIVAARLGGSSVFDRAYLSLALIGSGMMMVLLTTNWAMIS
jgi:hypothetical protein